jgi:hypothetical protein
MDELVKWLKALVFLQIQAVSGGEMAMKPEVLLSKAGLSTKEIAEMLSKNPAAIAKSLERWRKAAKAANDGHVAADQMLAVT